MPATEVFALTDEQIIGIGQDAADPAADTDDETLRGAVSAERESEPLDLTATERPASDGVPYNASAAQPASSAPTDAPAWLAERMRDPWHGDEAKELWDGKQKAEAEVATYRELFATAGDARTAAARARELDALDAAFYRGDAAARAQLAQRMMREDPAAFRQMVEAGLKLLGAEQARVPSEEKSLARAREDKFNSSDAAASARERNSAPPAPGLPAEAARAYGEFEKAANLELDKSVGASIARVMEDALPNLRLTGASATEGAQGTALLRDRLLGAVRKEIEGALKSDRQLGEQVSRILAARRFDAEARSQVVRLIDARAQQLVPGAVRRVVGSWTSATLASRGKAASASTAPLRTPQEKGSARAEQVPARKETPPSRMRPLDYRRISDEEILGI